MADFLKEFKFKMSFDKKDIKKNLNEISADVKNMLGEMGKASDKMPVFKQMAEYLENIGTALREIGAEDKDVFKQLFSGVDKNLVSQMEKLFSISLKDSQSIKNMFGQLNQIKSGDLKPTTQMLRGMAETLSDLYKAAGMESNLDLKFFSGKVGKADTEKRIQQITTALLNLSSVIGNVNDKITGMGNGGAGTGGGFGTSIEGDLEASNKKIQAQIDELEAQKKRYQEIADIFSGKTIDVSINKKTSASILAQTINEFKQVNATLNSEEFRNTASAEERTRLMAEQLRLAVRIQSIDKQLGDKGSDKAIDLSISARKTIDKAIEIAKGAKQDNDKKAFFEQDIKNINAQMLELRTPIDEIADTVKHIESPFGKMVNEAEYVQGIALQLEKLFNNINTMSGTLEYKVLLNGQEFDIKQGQSRGVSFQTAIESYLGTLDKHTIVSAHNHPGGTSSRYNVDDMRSTINDVYSGVAAMGMIVSEHDVTTLNLAKVHLDDALSVLKQIEQLGGASVSTTKINELFQALNPQYTNVAQTWQPSQFAELAKYIYDVGESANIAADPIEKFKNVLKLATDGQIDLSKYQSFFDNFDIKNAGNVFNQIMSLEGKDLKVVDTTTSSLSEFTNIIKHQQEALVQLRNEADVTYSDIHNMVQTYLSEVSSGSGVGEGASAFIKQYFGRNEQNLISDWLMELENGEASVLQITNRIAGYFRNIDPGAYLTDSMVAIEQANAKLQEFRELRDTIFTHVDYNTDDFTIGEYAGKLKVAYDELEKLAEQGLITADSLQEVHDICSSAKFHLDNEIKNYTDYYSGGSYYYSYEDEYTEARARVEALESENEALKERINLLKQISSAYIKQSDAEWALSEADTPKQEDDAEYKLDLAREAVAELEKQYHSVIVTMNDGSQIDIKLDDEFAEATESIIANSNKIKNIELVPGSVGPAIEAYERIASTKENIEQGISKSWGRVSAYSGENAFNYLTRVKANLEQCINSMTQYDPDGQWDFSHANQTAQEFLATINQMLPSFEMILQLETQLKDRDITPDEAAYYDVIQGIKDGTYTTVDQCVAKLQGLTDVIAEVKTSTDSISTIDSGTTELSGGTTTSAQPAQNIEAEIQQLERLKAILIEVEQAVQAKTKAFQAEGAVVEQTVSREITVLKELLTALGYIKAAIANINESFAGNSTAHALPVGSVDGDMGDVVKDAANGGYALDSTLLSTNSILQSILEAVNNNGSLNTLINTLNTAASELNNVANGIVQHQKSQRTDLSAASARISNNYGQLSSIASNAVVGMSDGGDDSVKIKGMKALADSVVRVEGAVKSANGVWKGFVVDINESNQAIINNTNSQSDYAKSLNEVAEASKQSDSSKKDDFTKSLQNQKLSLKDYISGLENVQYLSDDLRNKLNALGASLNEVTDEQGLKTWQDSFKAVVDDITVAKGTFESINSANIKKIKGSLNSELKALDFTATTIYTTDEQKEILGLRKQLIQQLEEYELNIKNGKETELSSINATLQALRSKISAYKEANDLVNATSQSGSKFGSTVALNATAKFNSLSEKASSGEFANSTAIKDGLKQYEAAYNRLIAKRKELTQLDIVPDSEKAEFKQLQTECNNFAKALEKIISDSQKLRANSDKTGWLGEDFDDSASGRAAALQDFVEEMYGTTAIVDKFTDANNKLFFTVDNGDGTFSRMTAEINAARSAIEATVNSTEKSISAFQSLWNEFKGKLRSVGTYLLSSFSIQEVWQQVRKGIQYVREIDSALAELKKVTDETDVSYNRFLQDMSKTGSVIGATVADLTTMAAEWARLGYSMQDAGKLAESTAILLNVSEFEDATKASEALISTMQAFSYTADESQHVVDILNEVGKLLPVDNYIG